MKKYFLALASVFLAFSLCAETKIYTVKDGTIQIPEKNELAGYVDTVDGIQIAVSANITDYSTVCFGLDLQNKSGEKYHFDNSCISVQGGNFETDEWTPVYCKTPEALLNEMRIAEGVAAAFNIAATGLIITDAILNGFDCYYDRRPHRHWHSAPELYIHYPRYYYYTPVYDQLYLSNLFFLMNYARVNKSYDFLLENLLYTTDIKPDEGYIGLLFLEDEKYPDYKVTVKASEEKQLEFVFAKSNRESIINPWSDREQIAAVMAGISVTNPCRWSLYYLFSDRLFGGYFGMNCELNSIKDLPDGQLYGYADSHYYNDVWLTRNAPYWDGYSRNKEYRYKFVQNESVPSVSDFLGFSAGFTVKPFPHVYIMAGCGIEMEAKNLYGDFYYKEYGKNDSEFVKFAEGYLEDSMVCDFYCTPQLGVNVSFNWIDAACIVEYRIGKGIMVNALVGFSF